MPGSLEVFDEVVADISATYNDDIHVCVLSGFLYGCIQVGLQLFGKGIAGIAFDNVAEEASGHRCRAEHVDAVFLEHGCAYGVINPCQNGRDIEDTLGHLAGHDVAVIAIRDGNKCIRAFHTSLTQNIHVGRGTDEALAFERCAKSTEGVRGTVDDGYVVGRAQETGYR